MTLQPLSPTRQLGVDDLHGAEALEWGVGVLALVFAFVGSNVAANHALKPHHLPPWGWSDRRGPVPAPAAT